MQNIFFTADTHFGHARIIEFVDRPFDGVEDMDAVMIERWNSVVKPRDQVYHLGDFSFSKKLRTLDILNSLNGQVHLVRGNHDHKRIKASVSDCFVWTKDYYELRLDNQLFVLSHYPMVSWNKSYYGSYMLHGHCHGTLPADGRRLDVGVDTHDFVPWSIDEVCIYMRQQPFVRV